MKVQWKETYLIQDIGEDFREFIIRLNVGYFATKMFSGMCYVSSTVKIRKAAMVFAEKILPALQEVLKKEIESETKV